MFRFWLILALGFLAACHPVGTNVNYDYNLSGGNARSKAIFLSFYNNQNAPFRFYLDKDFSKQEYRLTVRWQNPRPYLLFDRENSTLKFLINKDEMISLLPVKAPRIAAYLLDSGAREEEAEYHLTREQMGKIAFAKTVDVELKGHYIVVNGYLNKHSSLRAFKNFLHAM